MNQGGSRFSALGFKVLQQQKRELSINHSIVSSANLHGGSYEQLLQHFKNMLSNKIDLSLIHSSPHLKLKKYKEAVYYGQYIEGRRQGKGVMLYHNGQKYEGEWKNDQRHGTGFEVFANNSTYQGEYFQNKMQGQGKYCWPTGQTYEGEFVNNLKHGSGMWIDNEGNSYLGEWKLGEAFGFGVYTQSQGSRYEGYFQNFMKSGKGTQKFESGDLYKGQYELGRFNGFGEYYWKDGSYYKGNFKNGLRNGHGLWRKGQGNEKYEGQFVNNRKQGYGIYTWSCGNIYKGSYLANLRHGNGEMYQIDGSFYKGEWLVDKPNGRGELFDGFEKVEGIFKDGELIEKVQDQQQRHLSQFYTETPKVHKRYIQTPIKKITEQLYDINQKNRRLVLSQVEKDEEVREIKLTKSNKKVNPLIKDAFLKKKLLQTIALQSSNKQRESQEMNLRVTSKSNQRQKVLHSSFQIHRLHKKKNNTINVNNIVQPTADNNQKFAFGRGSVAPRRNRYFSRLE